MKSRSTAKKQLVQDSKTIDYFRKLFRIVVYAVSAMVLLIIFVWIPINVGNDTPKGYSYVSSSLFGLTAIC